MVAQGASRRRGPARPASGPAADGVFSQEPLTAQGSSDRTWVAPLTHAPVGLTPSTESPTFSEMVSENDGPPVDGPIDRRGRKRAANRDALLDHAAAIVDEHGVDGLTMTALAEAADYAPASLYTYFASRSSLVTALQRRALDVLGSVAVEHRDRWDEQLATADPAVRALARLLGFSRFFLSAPDHHPREFALQQRLLVTPGAADLDDVLTVVPVAMAVLDVPRGLLADAVEAGALRHDPATDPLDDALDPALVRTIAWVAALNGALLLDDLTTGLPTTGVHVGDVITSSLLAGWGADAGRLTAAADLAARLPQPRPGAGS